MFEIWKSATNLIQFYVPTRSKIGKSTLEKLYDCSLIKLIPSPHNNWRN
jgi:hypothetical protein